MAGIDDGAVGIPENAASNALQELFPVAPWKVRSPNAAREQCVTGKDDKVFVKVDGDPAEVIHQEHGVIDISPGVYEIGTVNEFDYEKVLVRHIID